jgi:IS1 family transposase
MIVAHASGRQHDAALAAAAVAQVMARTGERPCAWCGDGWHAYRPVLTAAYRRLVRTGRRGRPARRVPPELSLTRRIKHRTPTGRLIRIETEATLGAPVEPPDTVRVERLNGVLRDRLNALTRKTHAFAKTAATWDALLELAIFEHNWLRPHPALRLPLDQPTHPHARRFARRTPALALGLTDHPWRWPELLTLPTPISR